MFKHCKVIYFKTQDLSTLLNHNLRGKVIVSDFQELSRICNIHGLVHILNINPQKVPDGVDIIVCNSRNLDTESRIIRSGLGIPIVYYQMHQKWCGVCGELSGLDTEGRIGKYCSETCMKKATGFTKNGVPDAIRDLGANKIFSKKTIIRFDKTISDRRLNSNTKEEARRKSREKFQTSMVKEARRLEYAYKKESYKKEMRQPSHRKTKITSQKKTSNEVKLCKKIISKDGDETQCKNKAAEGSEYCRISSHRPIET